MVKTARWLLPDGVEEILPDEAQQLEALRRQILDDLDARGFNLVMPPLMEFVDSLLTGTGEELDTQTYKFMDQHTQRMLGIRADITPQAARIDAHHLDHEQINRLCYVGTVLRTQPQRIGEPRELLQIGAEVFGDASSKADIDVLEAMLAALELADTPDVTLSLGHIGVYKSLVQAQSIAECTELSLRDILLRKSVPDLEQLSDLIDIGPFSKLLSFAGDASVLGHAKSEFASSAAAQRALDELHFIVDQLSQKKALKVHVDLADVTGYRYHTGLMFTAFVSGRGRNVAQGGRYDHIGQEFGRKRAATGFSADLKTLLKLKHLAK